MIIFRIVILINLKSAKFKCFDFEVSSTREGMGMWRFHSKNSPLGSTQPQPGMGSRPGAEGRPQETSLRSDAVSICILQGLPNWSSPLIQAHLSSDYFWISHDLSTAFPTSNLHFSNQPVSSHHSTAQHRVKIHVIQSQNQSPPKDPQMVSPATTHTSRLPGGSPTPTLFMDQVIWVLPGVIVLDFASPQPSGLCSKVIVSESSSLTTYIKAHLRYPQSLVCMYLCLFLSCVLSFLYPFFHYFLLYLFLWYLSVPEVLPVHGELP